MQSIPFVNWALVLAEIYKSILLGSAYLYLTLTGPFKVEIIVVLEWLFLECSVGESMSSILLDLDHCELTI